MKIQEIIHYFQTSKEEGKVFYIVHQKIQIAKGDVCLHSHLGDYINIFWHQEKGNMILQKCVEEIFSHIEIQAIQVLKKVNFRHAHYCPYFEKQIEKSSKFYKPCACVMLTNQKNFLITRRKLELRSFPGAWVLPGGHLQKGQSLLQGGLRQAEQEVGLSVKQAKINLQNGVMAWESAFYKDGKILSCAFVVFFSCQIPTFQVKPQQVQIQQFKWKDIRDDSDQYKYLPSLNNGYGQAHLNYLSFYRNFNFQIKEDKKWIKKHQEDK